LLKDWFTGRHAIFVIRFVILLTALMPAGWIAHRRRDLVMYPSLPRRAGVFGKRRVIITLISVLQTN
jgi:hypothetical protein